ncbi:MAG TPA: iron-containing alcohol dehydrogenase [Myxococcota bacterium]|nr:iron-containing alcohol dehydrogenase [Myxococcota bacterium]
MQDIVRYTFPTTIFFGPGARRRLPAALAEVGASRPLVVTDRGLARLPVVAELVAMLRESGFDTRVYCEIFGNPVKSQVTGGTHAFRDGHRDSIVALGGGAALDVAKAIALMVHHPGDLFDYEDGKPGALSVDKPIPFIAALPTTAGTGSEVGRACVVSDDVTHAKKIVFHPRLMPTRVFADPELTLGLPAPITAATGMDALTHLVEAYLAPGTHPLCDGIALEGVRLVARSLDAAVDMARRGVGATPEHLAARGDMLNAAMMGAVAFQKGLGVTHSCAHALSTVCDLHHGLANGILLPATMTFNGPACPERFAALAMAAGAGQGPGTFVPWLRRLQAKLGVPATLAEVGVEARHLPQLVELALLDGCHATNPRPVARADVERIFREALGA